MLDRDSIIRQAIEDCLEEMYLKSQPSCSLAQIRKNIEAGHIDKERRIYEEHYLSEEEQKYIVEKYVNAYGLHPQWPDNVDAVLDWLKHGGYKKVPKDKDKMNEYDTIKPISEYIGEDNAKKVIDIVEECKFFYKFGRGDYEKFTFNVYNFAPSSNKETVEETNKALGVEVFIEDRTTDPDDLYEMDRVRRNRICAQHLKRC